MTLGKTVARNIRTLRQQKKLSMAALAQRAGLSLSHLFALEHALRTPPLDTLGTVAEALGVAPIRLLLPPSARGQSVKRFASKNLRESVVQNLLAVRRSKKLTQVDLSEKTGLSVSYISVLERGQRMPPLNTMEVFAKALGVNPLRLLEKPAAKSPRARKR